MSKKNWTYNVGLCGTMGRSVGVTDVVGGVLGSDGSLSFLGGSVSSVGGSLGVFRFNFYDGKVLSGDYSVRNFYDKRGMLIASQNARQAGLNLYSYYIYDAKGRLIEVGEIENLVGLTDVLVEDIKGYYDWFNGGVLKDVTVMGYDDNFGNLGSGGNYTRNRLYMVGRFTPGGKWGRGNPEYVSLISYDEHGNVQSVLNRLNSSDVLRRDVVKRLDYEYDLLSGDVRRVYYQRGKVDQLIHRYDYDDRGRLKSVWTSRDGEFWDRDGKYFYYGHGPLSRVEVGDAKVQGLDYVYTMQGWIKGMNGDLLNGGVLDYGRDGNAIGFEGEAEEGIHRYVGGDVAGFVMGYYGSLDYDNIGGVSVSGVGAPSGVGLAGLRNGNIGSMSTVLKKKDVGGGFVVEGVKNFYGYDQLNRLWSGDGYVYDGSGVFGSGSVYYGFGVGGALQVEDGYDANGNILMQRRDVGGVGVANYSYHYSKVGDRLVSNRLYHVGGLNGDGDLGFSGDNVVGTGCYGYDGIGELVKDRANGIERIDWDMFGKVRRVVRSAGSLLPDLEFRYDGMGRRVCKIVKPKDVERGGLVPENEWLWEWYVRDLDGNVMAMYEDSMDVNGVAWQRLEGHPVYGSGRLGMDNAGRVVARQGGILIGCVDFAGRTSIAGFYLSVNGNVVVNAYYSSVSSLIAAIEATGVYEAYWDGYLLKLWYIGGNPTATWVVLARTWGLEVPSTKLSVELCVDEGEMLSTTEFRHVVGAKVYEVSNHLGNVLATVSDRRERVMSGSVVSGFGAVIKSTSDYWPFGSELEGRQFDANRYKFGFGGMEKMQEVKSGGNDYDFGARLYDGDVGRWYSVEPLFMRHPSLSNYGYSANSPLMYKDKDGRDFDITFEYDENTGKSTITVEQDIYVGAELQSKVSEAVGELNGLSKTVIIDSKEYEVRFDIKVKNGNSIKEDLPNWPDDYNASTCANKINRKASTDNEKRDMTGAVTPNSKDISILKITKKKSAGTFDIDLEIDVATKPKAITHEILHTLGLDDKGGDYYDPDGRMEYKDDFDKMNDVSQKDVENIVKYALDNAGKIAKQGKPNVSLIGRDALNTSIKSGSNDSGGGEEFDGETSNRNVRFL